MKRVGSDSFVEEANLSHKIYKLREALGEGQNGEKYSETLPRRGYRFVAPIKQLEAPELMVEEHSLSQILVKEAYTSPIEAVPRAVGVLPTSY